MHYFMAKSATFLIRLRHHSSLSIFKSIINQENWLYLKALNRDGKPGFFKSEIMKTLTRLFVTSVLFFFATAASAQTTFKIDSVFLDSSTVNVDYCFGKDYTHIRVLVSLSNYTVGDSVEMIMNYGDGVVESRKFRIYGSGSYNYLYYSVFYHKYKITGVFQPQVIAIAPDLKTDTKICTGKAFVDVCGTISGNVYFDANNNCVKDASENYSYWSIVKATNTLTKSVKYAYINNKTGFYSLDLPYSYTYDIETDNQFNLQSCPSVGYKNVTVPSLNKNFGYQCVTGFDLSGIGWLSGTIRPGQLNRFTGRAHNTTCSPISGTYQLVVNDPLLSHMPYPNYGWYNSPSSINGDTVTWNFSNLAWSNFWNWWNSSQYFGYGIKIDTAAKLGDTVCVTIIVKPITGDNDTSNNVKKFCWVVGNSYDPNNKVGLPVGFGPDKIIARGQEINYTVNFQNTGNDTAYKISVVDTISPYLDLGSIEIHGATHPFVFYVVDENVIKFEFNDIYLPDSTTNEPLSHGSVNFTLHQKADLAYGTVITNNAAIYFDYNEAVITNTEHHKVDQIIGIHDRENASLNVSMYPNPASDQLFLEVWESDILNLRMFNMLGSVVMQQQLSNGKHSLDISEMTEGVYYVEVSSEDQRVVSKLVIQ